MASATPCTGCYPGWPHSYPETQRDWILRFWTRGHRPDSQLLYENFEQVTHAEALKRKAVLEAKWRAMRTHAGRVLVEMILRCHLKPFFGEMKVEDMRALDVDSYRMQRRSLVPRKGSATIEHTDRPIAGATFNREWSLLRTILNWGEANELIEKNLVRRGAVKMREANPRAPAGTRRRPSKRSPRPRRSRGNETGTRAR